MGHTQRARKRGRKRFFSFSLIFLAELVKVQEQYGFTRTCTHRKKLVHWILEREKNLSGEIGRRLPLFPPFVSEKDEINRNPLQLIFCFCCPLRTKSGKQKQMLGGRVHIPEGSTHTNVFDFGGDTYLNNGRNQVPSVRTIFQCFIPCFFSVHFSFVPLLPPFSFRIGAHNVLTIFYLFIYYYYFSKKKDQIYKFNFAFEFATSLHERIFHFAPPECVLAEIDREYLA